ncbi:MAG: beta-lactamase family protein [Planctomycetaceae bacterium]|nr:beta-lactamase family protein [Planctomycetaceae bacterium]
MSVEFPRLAAAIEQGVEKRLHTAVQVYVSLEGDILLDQGFGASLDARPIAADSIMLWRSAGKPVTAVAIMTLVERGELSLDSPLQQCLPEAAGPVGQLTLQDLLTHTSGLPLLNTGWPQSEWSDSLARILAAAPLDQTIAAYQPQSTWFLLGEVLRRQLNVDSFDTALRQTVLAPFGMEDVWCGLPEATASALQHRLPDYYEREKGTLVASPYGGGRWLTTASPGGNLRGPVSQLGRFYEVLLQNGAGTDGRQLLQPATVQQMTQRHRTDRFDEVLQHVIDFGLGVIIDSGHHGRDTVPYGFSRYCSPRSFGHGGAQCSIGFCDPDRQLVVAWATNAFCGEGQHQRRNRAINEAIYEDLGLATSG